jgi:hypothetical protein
MSVTQSKLKSLSKSIDQAREELQQLKVDGAPEPFQQAKDKHQLLLQEKKRQKDLYQAESFVNFMEYTQSKKKKDADPQAIKEAIEAKRARAREIYDLKQKIEDIYNEFDSQEIPGYLFFVNDILESYGRCPHVNIFEHPTTDLSSQPILKDIREVTSSRKAWLQGQCDQGRAYFQLRDRTQHHTNLKELLEKKESLVSQGMSLIQGILTESQNEIFEQTRLYIDLYTQATVKSKKIKAMFSNVINNCTLLKAETGLDIHHFLTVVCNVQILVNNASDSLVLHNTTLKNIVDQLNDCVKDIETEGKFLANTRTHGYYNLVEEIMYTKHNDMSQLGKYFCKWSELSWEQKCERMESFAKWYIDKYFVQTDIVQRSDYDVFVTKYLDAMKKGIETKIIKYRDLKWNNKSGMLTAVHGVSYNEETQDFDLQDAETQQKKSCSRARTSTKTIVTKANDKVINDTILLGVLRASDKSQILQTIKEKLRINKMTSSDKEILLSRIDDIASIVQTSERVMN